MNEQLPFRPETASRLRVLLVRIGAMGDVLHGLPALAGLRAALPEAEFGWAIEPHWAPLLQSCDGLKPLVDRVHLVPTRKWKRQPATMETLREIAALRRELRAVHYDVCVDLQGSIRSAFIGRLARTSRFIGPAAPRETMAKWLYGVRVATAAEHVVGQACELVGAAVQQVVTPAKVQLPFEPDAEGWASALLARVDAKRFVLLAPTAGWPAKEWPVERYAQLAQRLRGAGYTVLVNAPPSRTAPAANAIVDAGSAHLAAATLPQLIALTRRASLVIGGDTGPVHLASALGRPVVALFGPTDPARNGPYFPGNEAVIIMRNAASPTTHKRSQAGDPGLQNISMEQVFAQASPLLENDRG